MQVKALKYHIVAIFVFALAYGKANAANRDVYINVGGKSTGYFQSDTYGDVYLSGKPRKSNNKIFWINNAGWRSQEPFKTHRWSKKSWGLSIQNMEPGYYDCELYFAETSVDWDEVGKRVFKINLNGISRTNIDVYGATRQRDTAYVVPISNVQVPFYGVNQISLQLLKKKGNPFLSGITCNLQWFWFSQSISSKDLKLKSLSIDVGGKGTAVFKPVTSKNVVAWGNTTKYSDESASFTGTNLELDTILKTHLWSKYKWGVNLKQVPPGVYNCTLFFAETFYSTPGKRVFNAIVNGNKQSNIDVYKQVGKYTPYNVTLTDVKVPYANKTDISVVLKPVQGEPFLSAVMCN